MAHHAKSGPQDAPGGGRCRIIGRGDAPTLTLPHSASALPPAGAHWPQGAAMAV